MEWPIITVEPLLNQDTACCPSYIEKCTKHPLKQRHLFNQARTLHVVPRVSEIEVPLYYMVALVELYNIIQLDCGLGSNNFHYLY